MNEHSYQLLYGSAINNLMRECKKYNEIWDINKESLIENCRLILKFDRNININQKKIEELKTSKVVNYIQYDYIVE